MSVIAGRKTEEFSDDNDNRQDSANEGGDYDGSNSDLSDRGNGDGGNEVEKKVDDDEDRSNPQYIPKRGTFYEHDDRTAASGDEASPDHEGKSPPEGGGGGEGGGDGRAEAKPDPRQRMRRSDIQMWSHDKFIEDQQAPKSREELVAIYGYDIRNEDGPPHARRNRRYGRGPNKYTRTWEDEEAYRRQAALADKKKTAPISPPQGPEHFPQLDRQQQKTSPRTRPKPSRTREDAKENLENGSPRPLRMNINNNSATARPANPPPQKQTTTSVDKLMIESLTISAPNTNVKPEPSRQTQFAFVYNNDPSTRRVVTTAQLKPSPPQPPPTSIEQQKLNVNTGSNKSTLQQQQIARQQQLLIQQQREQQERHTAQQQQERQSMLQQKERQNLSQQQQVQQQQAQQENRSKRYSDMRQRPLADTYSPQPQATMQTPQGPMQTPQGPMQTAQGHMQTAQGPMQTAQGPMQTAQGPMQTAQGHMQTTQVPMQTAQLPMQAPQGQMHSVQGPMQTVQVPMQTVQGPMQTSQGPPVQMQAAQGQMQATQGAMQANLQHRLVQEFQPTNTQQIHSPQQLMHQYDMQVHRSTGTPPHQQQVRLSMMAEQPLVNPHMHPHSQMQVPQMQPAQLPPQQAYNPQAMMQAQYIQGGTPGAVYAAGVYPPQYQQHPHMYHNYGGGGGGTQYYSGGGEAPPARRPTAAIPIVPPPERSGSNSAERENIDRIVDNMFVRKQRTTESGKSDSVESSCSIASITEQIQSQSAPTYVENTLVTEEIPSEPQPTTNYDETATA